MLNKYVKLCLDIISLQKQYIFFVNNYHIYNFTSLKARGKHERMSFEIICTAKVVSVRVSRFE